MVPGENCWCGSVVVGDVAGVTKRLVGGSTSTGDASRDSMVGRESTEDAASAVSARNVVEKCMMFFWQVK